MSRWHSFRTGSLLATAGLAAFLAAGSPTQAAPPPEGARSEITERSQQSADRGIAWLLSAQRPDGAWGCLRGSEPSTSVTGLAALALMASGSSPGQGQYADAIEDALYWLLEVADRNRTTGQLALGNDVVGLGALYDHSMATTFLAEIVGMSNFESENERIQGALDRAIGFIARRQNPDGGWGQGQSDLPLTAQMWLALRCAHNAGTKIPPEVSATDVEQFTLRCSSTNGFTYSPSGAGGAYGYQHSFWANAAGLRIMYGLGIDDIEQVRRGAERLAGTRLGVDYGGQVSEWDYAGIFLACQALLIEDGPFWERWYPRVRDQLMGLQNGDGSWEIQYCSTCRAYATAMAVLTLLTPHRFLPMFQL